MESTKVELQREWRALSMRLDELFAESENRCLSDERVTAAWHERFEIYRRINEIVAAGVEFDENAAMREP